ncbi:hypothetical protein AJ87_35280 [Rhizobium yanglingense]|nr:hypothetical protein AJ87_35280 [Rhizobium yanglingense]
MLTSLPVRPSRAARAVVGLSGRHAFLWPRPYLPPCGARHAMALQLELARERHAKELSTIGLGETAGCVIVADV